METFTMSRKEVPRAGLVTAALAGKITNQEGARALRLTGRQFKRLKARFRQQGLRGLVHRRRGQPSPRRLPVELRELLEGRLVVLYQGTLLAAQPAPASTFVLTPRSDPSRDRQRAPQQPRGPARQLQTAVAALAHTLRARRPLATRSVATDSRAGPRLGAAAPHDLLGGRYLGIPPRARNPEAPPDPSRRASAPRHPWRTTFSPRQRRRNAARQG
jgi:Helix-turn-helix domain